MVTLTAIGLAGHFAGNLLTGRFKTRFIRKGWVQHGNPKRDFPLINRMLHFSHVISMIGLGITGFSLRFPLITGLRDSMRLGHYIFLVILVFTLGGRFYTAFVGGIKLRDRTSEHPVRRSDHSDFALRLTDIKNLPNVIKYYTFIKPDYPHIAKYNPLQKSMYGLMFPVLLIVQAYTGFALIWPDTMLGWLTGIFGTDPGNAYFLARFTHLTLMWILVVFTLIHVYMAAMEDFPVLWLMFRQRLPRYMAPPPAPIEVMAEAVSDEHDETVEQAEQTRRWILRILKRELEIADQAKNTKHATWLRQEIAGLQRRPINVTDLESEIDEV